MSQWMADKILNQVIKKQEGKEASGSPQVHFRAVTQISLMGQTSC